MSESKEQFQINVVPWYDAAQFKKVYECLFSHELVKKRWALDQISVWETRCFPSLPAAIEASYCITSAIVQDILWMNEASVNQQIDIQCIYSSAITRFVNLTIELHEDQQQPVRMVDLAKRIGIPSFIIDLRNEASHSVRPSLSCLRIAADAAMKYLKTSYWDKAALNCHVKKPVDVSDLKQLLQDYMRQQLMAKCKPESVDLHFAFKVNAHISLPEEDGLEIPSNCLVRKEAKAKAQAKRKQEDTQDLIESLAVEQILQKIEICLKKDKKLFMKVLVSDGIFIPYDEDFKPLVRNEAEHLLYQGELDNDSPKYSSRFDRSIIPSVPFFHEKLWFRVIALLHMYNSVPLFLETLLKTQGDRTVIGQKLIISWVMKILRFHTTGGRLEKSDLRKIFNKNGIVVNWKNMFYAAVANPCKYTGFLLSLILCHLDLKEDITQRLLCLVAIYQGLGKDIIFKNPASSIFTVDKLKRIKALQDAKIEKLEGISEDNIWSLPKDDMYKTWPIGHINNPINPEIVEDLEDDLYDTFIMKDDFSEKFIFTNNENDNEDSVMEDSEDLDSLEDYVLQEISNRKSFLYKK